MANPVVRGLVAVSAGLVVAMVVIAGVEAAGHALFPRPPGLDLARSEDQARIIEEIPFEARLAVILAWFLGSLAGAATAIAIARRVLPAWIVCAVIAALGLWTTQMFPHPAWMVVSAVALPLVAVPIAGRLLRARLARA